jgi:hypothetical protein
VLMTRGGGGRKKQLSGVATCAQHGGRQWGVGSWNERRKDNVYECGVQCVVRWGDAGMI